MPTRIELRQVTRDDVLRISGWLADKEVAEAWFGRYTYGDPVHLGYNPKKMAVASEAEWLAVFGPHDSQQRAQDDHRDFFSVYTTTGSHIGEGQLNIEPRLGDAHLSILIGRKVLWHQGYGTAASLRLLEHAFDHLDLYRVWVDVPTYNVAARNMFEERGFKHEGTLRKSRPHEGARYDSFIMGMLKDEYHRLYPSGASEGNATPPSQNV